MTLAPIITTSDLDRIANDLNFRPILPELVHRLIRRSVSPSDLLSIHMPYGDGVGTHGVDGEVESGADYLQYVHKGRSYWEMGVSKEPDTKAKKDYRKRVAQLTAAERESSRFVFVTPRIWQPSRREALQALWRMDGWHGTTILDGNNLAAWLGEFPSIALWLATKIGLTNPAGLSTPAMHWQRLKGLERDGHALPADVFLVGRDAARRALDEIFNDNACQLALPGQDKDDVFDFVAAHIEAMEDSNKKKRCSDLCLFIHDEPTWLSYAIKERSGHVLVASSKLDLDDHSQLHGAARTSGCNVVFPSRSMGRAGSPSLPQPRSHEIKPLLESAGFPPELARQASVAGNRSLSSLKRFIRGLGAPEYSLSGETRSLALAMLPGGWFGGNPNDVAAVERLVRSDYASWIEMIRVEALRPDAPLGQHEDSWKFLSRGEAWKSLGRFISKDDLDAFRTVCVEVLREVTYVPRSGDEITIAPRPDEDPHYSGNLRFGLAETLALLGVRGDSLTQCAKGVPAGYAFTCVREILRGADGPTWASLQPVLPMLAEASPQAFMEALGEAVGRDSENPVAFLFSAEVSGLFGREYLSGLLWALEGLAWDESNLLPVASLLGKLTAMDPGGKWGNRPSSSLARIFLPWHPATTASSEKRLMAIKMLLAESPEVGWKLLLGILPTGLATSTFDSHRPTWVEYIPLEWNFTPPGHEVHDEWRRLCALAVSSAVGKIDRLADLIRLLSRGNSTYFEDLAGVLRSPTVMNLSEEDRLPLWEAIEHEMAEHRGHPDAFWALDPQEVEVFGRIARELGPGSVFLSSRRLFAKDCHGFYEPDKGSYAAGFERLNQMRREAILHIHAEFGGWEGIDQFRGRIEDTGALGRTLGESDLDLEGKIIPTLLLAEDPAVRDFVSGFIDGRRRSKGWAWIDAMPLVDWSIGEAIRFLFWLPFDRSAWERVDLLPDPIQAEYWKTSMYTYANPDDISEAVSRLRGWNRPRLALRFIAMCVARRDQDGFEPKVVLETLLETLSSEETVPPGHGEDLVSTIDWLYGKDGIDLASLEHVESAYLEVFGYGFRKPRALLAKLAREPDFFCEVLGLYYRPEGDAGDAAPSEERMSLADRAGRLLYEFRRIPGTREDGTLDPEAFASWVRRVRELAASSGHLKIAMDKLGSVLATPLADPGGLWLHKSVAGLLQEENNEIMRKAFHVGLFNLRGTYTHSGGVEEDKIAEAYMAKADALDSEGFWRVAKVVRDLAASYRRDAARDREEDAFS